MSTCRAINNDVVAIRCLQACFDFLVGLRGFEPPTPGPPDQCANQTAPQPAATPRYLGYRSDPHVELAQVICCNTQTIPSSARHPRYRTAPVTTTQKCQGTDPPLGGSPSHCPQAGQPPWSSTRPISKSRLHRSHQVTIRAPVGSQAAEQNSASSSLTAPS